jgi:hypothetical protein
VLVAKTGHGVVDRAFDRLVGEKYTEDEDVMRR